MALQTPHWAADPLKRGVFFPRSAADCPKIACPLVDVFFWWFFYGRYRGLEPLVCAPNSAANAVARRELERHTKWFHEWILLSPRINQTRGAEGFGCRKNADQ